MTLTEDNIVIKCFKCDINISAKDSHCVVCDGDERFICSKCRDEGIKEFIINDLITMKLIDKKTVIMVNGEEISQCMFLMINIPKKETNDTFDYVNIDECAKNYSSD